MMHTAKKKVKERKKGKRACQHEQRFAARTNTAGKYQSTGS
jgi:hypothetical protein